MIERTGLSLFTSIPSPPFSPLSLFHSVFSQSWAVVSITEIQTLLFECFTEIKPVPYLSLCPWHEISRLPSLLSCRFPPFIFEYASYFSSMTPTALTKSHTSLKALHDFVSPLCPDFPNANTAPIFWTSLFAPSAARFRAILRRV